jgi:uncharacterized protein YbjQ (UPF0145 family)
MAAFSEEQQERSQRELEAGGLPLAAQDRLRALAAGDSRLFTSDLSVSEFALLHKLGVTPVTQVMGSSIFQHGWQTLPRDNWYGYSKGQPRVWGAGRGLFSGGNYGPGDGSSWSQELTYLSDAFNGARDRALARLRAEAELAGAHAVVGVQVNDAAHDFAGPGTVEFTAIGTAVRLPEALHAGAVVITDLSAQEYVLLARSGFRPVGFVGVTTVMYIASGVADSWVLSSGNSMFSVAGRANQELSDFTRGFYDAREAAMWRLDAAAAEAGAHGVVGVKLSRHMHEREYDDANENKHHDLVVYIHVLGTAITEGHPPLETKQLRTVLPMSRVRAGRL